MPEIQDDSGTVIQDDAGKIIYDDAGITYLASGVETPSGTSSRQINMNRTEIGSM